MSPKDFGRIGILAGGPSSERSISLESGTAVFGALKDAGADAVFLDIQCRGARPCAPTIIEEIRAVGVDVAFIALHGKFGEDGTIQRILEDNGIPYTGSGPLASRLALDKIASKELFIKKGIDVPRYIVLDKGFGLMDFRNITQVFNFPIVVKPQFEGSSIGISIVKDKNGLSEAINTAFCYGDKILIEEYIKGRELTVGILDDEPLPVIEIIVKEQFYDFNAKYQSSETEYIVPAKIDEKVYKRAQQMGKSAHLALGCDTFSRADMMWDQERDRLVMLEVNSIPGFTSHSLLPKAAAFVGIGFAPLCLKITESALKRRKESESEKLKI